jgi:hypothetical protein
MTGKDANRGLLEELSKHLPGMTEENLQKRQSGQCPGGDSNRAPTEEKSSALILDEPVLGNSWKRYRPITRPLHT